MGARRKARALALQALYGLEFGPFDPAARATTDDSAVSPDPVLDPEEGIQTFLQEFPLTQPVLDEAVRLRQQRRMSLGDALIAATALVHGLRLVTRNVDDFRWVDGLNLLNPLGGLP